jgi:FdhD protein
MDAIGIQHVSVEKARAEGRERHDDVVAIEEPLEIRVLADGEEGLGRPISVTMRTPGHDTELALGFLFGEGLLRDWRSVRRVRPAGPTGNVLRVELQRGIELDLARLQRNFYTTSSCGVCGKASIEAVTSSVLVRHIEADWTVDAAVLHGLPAKLREAQAAFAATGGLHAVGLFTRDGDFVASYEDVGRHNAMDKLVGSRLLADALPLADSIVLLSGRASFELVQKAGAAGVPLLAAIGAPSSLAIELAEQAGMTLVAFLRNGTFNLYTHGQRVR